MSTPLCAVIAGRLAFAGQIIEPAPPATGLPTPVCSATQAPQPADGK
jgi:hypothetical protein